MENIFIEIISRVLRLMIFYCSIVGTDESFEVDRSSKDIVVSLRENVCTGFSVYIV